VLLHDALERRTAGRPPRLSHRAGHVPGKTAGAPDA
jgi:hypothetical protein